MEEEYRAIVIVGSVKTRVATGLVVLVFLFLLFFQARQRRLHSGPRAHLLHLCHPLHLHLLQQSQTLLKPSSCLHFFSFSSMTFSSDPLYNCRTSCRVLLVFGFWFSPTRTDCCSHLAISSILILYSFKKQVNYEACIWILVCSHSTYFTLISNKTDF